MVSPPSPNAGAYIAMKCVWTALRPITPVAFSVASARDRRTASIALKPTSSILIPGRSVNLAGEPVDVVTKGRHDPCVGIRATPIAEAMMALVLMDHALRHRAQCGDVGPVAPRIA